MQVDGPSAEGRVVYVLQRALGPAGPEVPKRLVS